MLVLRGGVGFFCARYMYPCTPSRRHLEYRVCSKIRTCAVPRVVLCSTGPRTIPTLATLWSYEGVLSYDRDTLVPLASQARAIVLGQWPTCRPGAKQSQGLDESSLFEKAPLCGPTVVVCVFVHEQPLQATTGLLRS